MNKFVTIGLGAAAVVVVLFLAPSFSVRRRRLRADWALTRPPTATAEPTPDADRSGAVELGDGSFPRARSSSRRRCPGWRRRAITVDIPAPGWTYSELDRVLEKGEGCGPAGSRRCCLACHRQPGRASTCTGIRASGASTTPETPATTVEEIVAALAAQASRDASAPVDVTVGGYAGKMITLHVPMREVPTRPGTSSTIATRRIRQLRDRRSEPSRDHQGRARSTSCGSWTWRARS